MTSTVSRPTAMLLLLLTSLLMTSSAFDGCHINFGRRGCTHRIVNGVAAICDGNHGAQSSIPRHLPHGAVYLSLVGFNLTRLTRADLDRFTSVQCLMLSDSPHLTSIDADAFAGMEALVELTLDGTAVDDSSMSFIGHPSFGHVEMLAVERSPRLRHVSEHGAAKSLHALRTLRLRDNAIREDLPASMYGELRRLERLDLTGNRLTAINWTALSHATSLNALQLAGNRIQLVPGVAHGVFYAVKELTLAGNPLHCNCHMNWLREFYRRSAVDKTVDAVTCSGPEVLPIDDPDGGQNFRCVEPEQPVITWSENGRDGRIEINCTSFGDPAPSLLLTFSDGRRLVSPPSVNLSERDSSTPQVLINPGVVTCQASNTHGVSTTLQFVGPQHDSSVSDHGVHLWLAIPLLVSLNLR